jgi:amino acid adenylation domain-containing protein
VNVHQAPAPADEYIADLDIDGPAEVDRSGDVVEDFIDAARSWPHRVAVAHNGDTITYRELEERIRLCASRYRKVCGDPGDAQPLIGVLASHRPALVDHLLGILRAGAVYCPIDAAMPSARRESLAAALGVDQVSLITDAVRTPTKLHDDVAWRPDHLAYALCTSGSTGAPKPVVVSRHALAVTVRALRSLFELTPEDRVLQFASLGWDTCFEEILPTLTSGAALVFDDASHTGSLPSFVRMLAERAITVLDLPTAFWHELVLYLEEEQATLPVCVRLVVIGGERVDPTRLRQWRDLGHTEVGLLNTYGCTETTMVTHAVLLSGPGTEPDVATCDAEIPLGRPLPHVRDHVTDEGELLVSGPNLATGYLGLQELTATGFPVADHGHGPVRWFRTGDLVARGERGLLHPRGRIDEQVKVLGVRVHPAEVEAQLNTHPAVGGAVVIGERRLGRTSLTAYVVSAATTSPGELQRYLRKRLPSQFVPTRVAFVESLAYTSSGKVDRAATQRAAANRDNKAANHDNRGEGR